MASPDSARLFLALWPEPDLRARLAAWRDAWSWPASARPVADESLHLTLHFIGDFAAERIAELDAALAEARAVRSSVRAQGPDVWKGGIAVLRFEPSPPLLWLHGSLARALSSLGVALDPRPFSPHITLARKAWHARPPAEAAPFEWPVTGYVLVESVRGPRAAYRVLRRYDAAGSS